MVTLKELWWMAWRPSGDQWQVTFLRAWYWDQHCLTSLSSTWTVGLSAPSARLLTTPGCVVQSTCWREGTPSRGTLTGFRELGQCESSEVQQRQMQGPSHGLGQTQAQIQAGWRMDWEKTWGGLQGAGWPETQHDLAVCACRQEG